MGHWRRSSVSFAFGEKMKNPVTTSNGEEKLLQVAVKEITEIANNDDAPEYLGLRIPTDYTGTIKIGDELPASKVWIDGDITDEELNGVSTIGIKRDWKSGEVEEATVVHALKEIGAYPKEKGHGWGGYSGNRVLLVGGYSAENGEDAGELIIRNNEVLGIWNRKKVEHEGHYIKWGSIIPNHHQRNKTRATDQNMKPTLKKKSSKGIKKNTTDNYRVAEENAQRIFLELQAEQDELRKQFPQIMPTMQAVIDAKKRVKKNPGTKAQKKALAWYQKESLVNGSQVIKLPDTVEAVEIGRIVSITYESDKYDGKKRLWKHDVTGQKTLHISTDGKVMVILPGFKITKRGIEG